ncbi:HNH endonuclease [Streptomyces sp. NRRL F-5630]|uniref:HNH endonuclease signature motif containing protein n=1 Tax=Streptomyces sp. NRRL F-5630 TaxID=1463864 RepID=UPI003D765A5D
MAVRYTDEELRRAFAGAGTLGEVMERLGVAPQNVGQRNHVRSRLEAMGCDLRALTEELPDWTREELAEAVAAVTSWKGLARQLGVRPTAGRCRTLRRRVAADGIDASHFVQRVVKYSDEALAEATRGASSLREVALALGAVPASGTLSHLSRRIVAAGISTAHMPGLRPRSAPPEPTLTELRAAAARVNSVPGLARALGLSDDTRTVGALRRRIAENAIDTSHFVKRRLPPLPAAEVREAVARCTSYAEVARALGLPLGWTTHRRVRDAIDRLGLDTGHFTRRPWAAPPPAPAPPRATLLRVHPPTAARVRRDRLHPLLQALGRPYACARCGNPGHWDGEPLVLHIDHVNGDWHDNRAENLRYLCPNCHSLTETWGRRSRLPDPGL